MINTVETVGLIVNSISPSKYSSNVDINSSIEIGFNSMLDTKTISSSVFLLKDINNKSISEILTNTLYDLDITEFENVKCSISYSNSNIILKPVEQLSIGSRYFIYVNKSFLKDFSGYQMLTNYISVFETSNFNTYPKCNIVYPQNNTVVSNTNIIEFDNLGSNAYIVQISKNKEFENAIIDKVVFSNKVEDVLLNDGSYYIRIKATEGIFGDTAFFTVKTIPNTLVSDEDNTFSYVPLDEKAIEITESFPIGINIHEMTNLCYMKFDGIIDNTNIDYYESSVTISSLLDNLDNSNEDVDGVYISIIDNDNETSYIAFIPDEL